MGLISNGTTIFDAGALSAGLGFSMTFIKKLTASSSSSLGFTNGASSVVLDSTYKEYLFIMNNLHFSDADCNVIANITTGSNTLKTSSAFLATHGEDGSSGGVAYDTAGKDLAQSNNGQTIAINMGVENDECMCGTLSLFNPGSTTFVKHYTAVTSYYQSANIAQSYHIGGYCNTTSAITNVSFEASAGTIDTGTITMYGIA